jgi:hypothetical protein
MPTAAKRKRSIVRKCSAGGAKLRLKGLSKRARSEGGSELVRCRASRPVAGGLYKGKKPAKKKPAPKRKSVKNGDRAVRGSKALGGMLMEWVGPGASNVHSAGSHFYAEMSVPKSVAIKALAEMRSIAKYTRGDRPHALRTAKLLAAAIKRAER